jgi:Rha family phage regulatory protein
MHAADQRYDIFRLKSSRTVVEIFNKNHRHILRDIDELTCTEEFNRSNFGLTSYNDPHGKVQRMYGMTKIGMYQDKVVNLFRLIGINITLFPHQ